MLSLPMSTVMAEAWLASRIAQPPEAKHSSYRGWKRTRSSSSTSRPQSRKDRTQGLGIKGLDTQASTVDTQHNDDNVANKPSTVVLGRSDSTRSPLMSIFNRSSGSSIGRYRPGSSRSNTSTITRTSTSETSGASSVTTSPSLWQMSNHSTASCITEASEDLETDLSTYHANLARFKAERAERTAKLGVEALGGLWKPDTRSNSSESERSSVEGETVTTRPREEAKVQLGRKNSSLSVRRGLKAYWGGGNASDAKNQGVVDLGSLNDDFEKEAFKEWWDRLGNESASVHGFSIVSVR